MSKEWAELAFHVTEKIKEHDACITEIEKNQTQFKIDMAVFKVKLAIFAAIAPFVLGGVAWGFKLLIDHIITQV